MAPRKRKALPYPSTRPAQDLSLPVWKLPAEIWLLIGRYHSTSTLAALTLTCKRLSEIFPRLLYRRVRAGCHYRVDSHKRCEVTVGLLKRLATSQLASFTRSLDLTLACSFPPAPPPHDTTVKYYGKRAIVEAEDKLAAKRNEWLSNVSRLSLCVLKKVQAELTRLTLGGNLFPHFGAKNLKAVRGFGKLRKLRLDCERNTLASLLDLFEFVERMSLEELLLDSGRVQIVTNPEKPNETSLLFTSLRECIAALSATSPNLHTLDLHLYFERCDDEALRKVEDVIDALFFPRLRRHGLHVRMYPWTGHYHTVNHFNELYETHSELLGKDVSAQWNARGCVMPPGDFPRMRTGNGIESEEE